MSGYVVDTTQDQPPAEIEGWDEDRAVSFQIDAKGDPVGIRVADDWSRRIQPSALGPAVLAASAAAVRARQEQRTKLGVEGVKAEVRAAALEAAQRPVQPAQGVTPRSLNELAEDVISLSQLVRSTRGKPTAPLSGTGTAAGGALVVTVGQQGLTSFDVDSAWAALRAGFAISVAAGSALGAARSDLARAIGDSPGGVADGLLAEAMARLTALSAPSSDDERNTSARGL